MDKDKYIELSIRNQKKLLIKNIIDEEFIGHYCIYTLLPLNHDKKSNLGNIITSSKIISNAKEIDFVLNEEEFNDVIATIIRIIEPSYVIDKDIINDFFKYFDEYLKKHCIDIFNNFFYGHFNQSFDEYYNEYLYPLLNNIDEFTGLFFETFKENSDSLPSVLSEIKNIFFENKFDFNSINSFNKTILDSSNAIQKSNDILNHYNKNFEIASKKAFKYEWFLSIDAIVSITELDRIIKFPKNGNSEEFNQIMFEIYNEKLIERMITFIKSSSLLEKYSKIFAEIELAINNNFYHLAILGLFTIIEYVLHEIKIKSNSNNLNMKQRVEEVYNLNVYKSIEIFYLNKILKNFKRNHYINSKISRHAILHGSYVNYGSKENLVKLIILLHSLISIYYINDPIKLLEDNGININ